MHERNGENGRVLSESETPRRFGDREIGRNDMTVLSQYVPRTDDPNRTTQENLQAYTDKIQEVARQYPRNEGESLADYRRRIDEAFGGNRVEEWEPGRPRNNSGRSGTEGAE